MPTSSCRVRCVNSASCTFPACVGLQLQASPSCAVHVTNEIRRGTHLIWKKQYLHIYSLLEVVAHTQQHRTRLLVGHGVLGSDSLELLLNANWYTKLQRSDEKNATFIH